MTLSDRHLALRAAAQWHARLGAAPECPKEQVEFQSWIKLDPLNSWAWERVEHLQAGLQDVPGGLARHALSNNTGEAGRRVILKSVVLGLGLAGLAWNGYQRSATWLADLRTGVGERRNVVLADGTRLFLNTASAVDIRYDAGERLLILHDGEILVETASDPRPFRVRTIHGEMLALGTRFDVRMYGDHTRLAVLEHTVLVHSASAPDPVKVEAGMGLDFANGQLPFPKATEINESAWSQGRLIINEWRLDRALVELERYRFGFIRCSDEVADLRVSGVFPLDDIDRALMVIAQALKLKVHRRTRFWVQLTSAT
ncbi:MAG: FecR domain-containing protein [Pseudomonas sp.]|uniref:FecR domain-containing protein n=1 Tax=Pseudomonas putida TaxID=303 RepID=UPI0021F86D0D|nr:FecR domain-containing protein [Pseudomonas putida]